jgi:hypothetical protein
MPFKKYLLEDLLVPLNNYASRAASPGWEMMKVGALPLKSTASMSTWRLSWSKFLVSSIGKSSTRNLGLIK